MKKFDTQKCQHLQAQGAKSPNSKRENLSRAQPETSHRWYMSSFLWSAREGHSFLSRKPETKTESIGNFGGNSPKKPEKVRKKIGHFGGNSSRKPEKARKKIGHLVEICSVTCGIIFKLFILLHVFMLVFDSKTTSNMNDISNHFLAFMILKL